MCFNYKKKKIEVSFLKACIWWNLTWCKCKENDAPVHVTWWKESKAVLSECIQFHPILYVLMAEKQKSFCEAFVADTYIRPLWPERVQLTFSQTQWRSTTCNKDLKVFTVVAYSIIITSGSRHHLITLTFKMWLCRWKERILNVFYCKELQTFILWRRFHKTSAKASVMV